MSDFSTLFSDGFEFIYNNGQPNLWFEANTMNCVEVIENVLRRVNFSVVEHNKHKSTFYKFTIPIFVVAREGNVQIVNLFEGKISGSNLIYFSQNGEWYHNLSEAIKRVSFVNNEKILKLNQKEFMSILLKRPICHHNQCLDIFNTSYKDGIIKINKLPCDKETIKLPLCLNKITEDGEKFDARFYEKYDMASKLPVNVSVIQLEYLSFVENQSKYFNLRGTLGLLDFHSSSNNDILDNFKIANDSQNEKTIMHFNGIKV